MTSSPSLAPRLALPLLIGSLGILVLGMEPILLGAMVTEQRIAEHAVGTLVTTELLTIAIGSVLGLRLLARFPAPVVGILAGLLMAAANAAAIGNTGLLTLVTIRACAGFIEGVLMSVALVAIARNALPERGSGLFLATQTLLQLIAVLIVPRLLTGGSHVDLCLAILVGAGLTAAGFAAFLPRRLEAPRPQSQASTAYIGNGSVIALLAAGAFMGAILSVWGYLGLWIARNGYAVEVEGSVVAVSLGAQILGALLAARFGGRQSPRHVIVAAAAVQISVIMLMIYQGETRLDIHLMGAMFGFLWLFTVPAFTGLLVEIDPARRAVLYIAAAQLGGAATLPLLAGTAVAYGGVNGAFWLASTVLALALVLVAGLGRSVRGKARPVVKGTVPARSQAACQEP